MQSSTAHGFTRGLIQEAHGISSPILCRSVHCSKSVDEGMLGLNAAFERFVEHNVRARISEKAIRFDMWLSRRHSDLIQVFYWYRFQFIRCIELEDLGVKIQLTIKCTS